MFELELKNVRIRERRAKQEDLSRKCTEREGRRTKDKIDRRGDEDPEKEEERWGGRRGREFRLRGGNHLLPPASAPTHTALQL